MLQNGSYRKESESENSEGEDYEQQKQMFPRLNQQGLKSIKTVLRECYKKDQHSKELLNFSFRCHRGQYIELYNDFRKEHHPELSEPSISTYYSNDCFANLTQISKSLHPNQELPMIHIGPCPPNLKDVLDSTFLDYGYIPNLERFMLFYPTYLEKHTALSKLLFEGGKIDASVAYFLGICAAAELGSLYMMSRMIKKFNESGGNFAWLESRKYPDKIAEILILNRKLARCVWEISSQDIDSLEHWNHNDLCFCIQIMAYTHSLSTIALALGLLPEEENLHICNMFKIQKLKQSYDQQNHPAKCTDKLATVMPQVNSATKEAEQGSITSLNCIKASKKDIYQESIQIEHYMTQIGSELTKQTLYVEINKLVSPLLPEYSIIKKRDHSLYPTWQHSDFNFKYMAYPILHNLTGNSADKLRDLVNYSDDMTFGNFGQEMVSTTGEFRKAMRYYSQNLCGEIHQGYDYRKNITTMMTMALKFYTRLLTLSPLHITKQVLREINHESGQVGCFDLGHVAVMIANTKMGLALTYAAQAFAQ